MENGFMVITGASKGIGEAIAARLLAQGHTVLGVARSRSARLGPTRYHHLSCDLSDTASLGQITGKAGEIAAAQNFAFLGLVNNASAIEPFGSIEKCMPDEIDRHIKIGLIAPMILTSLFIGKFAGSSARKKVVFISSGAAFRALPDESVYCGTKAGLHMFAQCVGLEQKDKANGFELISIGPGMVDTTMQEAARSKSLEEFALADFYREAFESGKLQKPDAVADKICAILENTYDQGQYVSVGEV